MDTLERLKEIVGKDIISVKTSDNGRAAQEIKLRYQIEARRDGDGLTFEIANGEEFLPSFVRKCGTEILRSACAARAWMTSFSSSLGEKYGKRRLAMPSGQWFASMATACGVEGRDE